MATVDEVPEKYDVMGISTARVLSWYFIVQARKVSYPLKLFIICSKYCRCLDSTLPMFIRSIVSTIFSIILITKNVTFLFDIIQ